MEATNTPGQQSFLRIRNLWKAFGNFYALKEISLDIEDGEFVCFLGPSGCGKTTLLRAIDGLDLQTNGTVEQAGQDISTHVYLGDDHTLMRMTRFLTGTYPAGYFDRMVDFALEALEAQAQISNEVLKG